MLELLVVTVVFSLILTVVLGFYVWGHNTTESQSRIADNDRRMMQMVDRLRTLLVSGEIDRVISTEIDFTPIDTTGLDRRVANMSSNAESIVILPASANPHGSVPTVILRTQGHTETILVLQPYETLTFSYNGSQIDITDSGNPPVQTQAQGILHPYTLTRSVMVVPPL